jgi:6,7-dimethyl-8-ribityllumazine synthase
MPELRPGPLPAGRIVLLAARYNDLVVRALIAGSLDVLADAGYGAEQVDRLWVPGAFELPLLADRALATGRYLGAVALGCVLRGATAHFEHVAGNAVRGLLDVALAHGRPIGLGVLTCDSLEQALERAGGKAGNKGAEAARALLDQLRVLAALETGA